MAEGARAGEELSSQGKGCGCNFEVQLEFVNVVDGGDLPGWVLKKVQAGQHELSGTNIQHELVTILPEVRTCTVRVPGDFQIKITPYFQLGLTLKESHHGAMSINRALRQRAAEMGQDLRWNLEQMRTIFGITVKEELVDLGDTLKVLNSKHAESPNMHHAIRSSTQLSRLTRIFHDIHLHSVAPGVLGPVFNF